MNPKNIKIGSKDTEITFVQSLHYRLTQKPKVMTEGSNSIDLCLIHLYVNKKVKIM
jgi:hypothetical protein